jgi:hypothetical protein
MATATTTTSPKITSHKDLAAHIAGKSILHLNSLGKDAALCLEWLNHYARPSKIVSLYCALAAKHPDDDRYLRYQKKRYPGVQFLLMPSAADMSQFSDGVYQSPIECLLNFNHWEHRDFDWHKLWEAVRVETGCDLICSGEARYEHMARAMRFYKRGLLIDKTIYPLGFFSKQQVIQAIKASGIKLHPSYKLAPTTLDHPSFWKMRASWLAHPKYKEECLRAYPMLALDEYRWETLFQK